MRCFIKTLFLLFIIFGTSILKNYGQSVFKNNSQNEKIAEIFNTYQNIDSIYLQYEDKAPSTLFIYEPLKEKHSNPYITKDITTYKVDFEADQLWLNQDYKLIYQFIFQDELESEILKTTDKKDYTLTITSKKSAIRDFLQSGGVGAVINPHKKLDFINLLNTNYRDCTDVIKDSVLIIQAVILRNGEIGDNEIIYGKSRFLYNYFMKTYYSFEASQPIQKKDSRDFQNRNEKWLFKPRISNTQRTSLIDIYLRLNPDKTFTLSAQGNYRRLKIKDYHKNPNDPIFY
ncbi:hypothetical protein HCX49_03450 [Sphingobacterium kitahiroshimense]|uniref:hypothetical protein n=1 Tax=Sphingobacterium sp. B16(2022) TaxID=2914044 RepID=UPI00143BAC05|nr:hypothetical protein [Sphingobacterium sp. B16(2022)]NJI72252.1 hypothetical protein [Sphingobacterium sp. B16(2022)]